MTTIAELAELVDELRERSTRYRTERNRARATLERMRLRHARVQPELRRLRALEDFVIGRDAYRKFNESTTAAAGQDVGVEVPAAAEGGHCA